LCVVVAPFKDVFTTFHHFSPLEQLEQWKKITNQDSMKSIRPDFLSVAHLSLGWLIYIFLRPKFRPQKALFKDEHHHEVLQTQGACALEAFRAACAGAM